MVPDGKEKVPNWPRRMGQMSFSLENRVFTSPEASIAYMCAELERIPGPGVRSKTSRKKLPVGAPGSTVLEK